MDVRYFSAHTRYSTKEDERLKQEKKKETVRHAVAPPQKQDRTAQAPSQCHGNACDQSLYSQEFQDDLVFGPPAMHA